MKPREAFFFQSNKLLNTYSNTLLFVFNYIGTVQGSRSEQCCKWSITIARHRLLPKFEPIAGGGEGVASPLNTSHYVFFKYESFDYASSIQHALHARRCRRDSSSTHARAETYAVYGLFKALEKRIRSPISETL